MERNSGKRIGLFLVFLLVAATVFATLHFSKTEKPEEGTVSLYYHGKQERILISNLPLEPVEGIRVNGKGEEIKIEGEGILLSRLLSDYKVEEYVRVKLTASDSYSATVTKEEIEEPQKVYLLWEEDGLRLVVFGDPDSKRSVSEIVQISVE